MDNSFEGQPTISNKEIDERAGDMLKIIRGCNSPKDACLVFAEVYILFLHSAFPPEMVLEAKRAVDVMAIYIKKSLDEGWK